MPDGTAVSQADVLELFSAYGDGDTFKRLLRDMCANDKRLHFQASNDRDRNVIRGAHDRNLYFLSLIKKANERK